MKESEAYYGAPESAMIEEGVRIGRNVIIGENVIIKEGAVIKDNCCILDDCILEEGVYIDYNTILRENVHIGKKSFVGAGSIIGEYLADFFGEQGRAEVNEAGQNYETVIGDNSLIRSGAIIYGDNRIGHDFQTGHRVTIRERSSIGHHVRVGTLSDIQGECEIGNYVNIHSHVHVGQKSIVKNFAWLFPYVVLTNDPTPPSKQISGVTVEEFAAVAAGSIVLPGIRIGKDALVGAGALVNKDVEEKAVVVGNPARRIGNVEEIRNKTDGGEVYPWRYYFDRGMPWEGRGYEGWRQECCESEKYHSLSDEKVL